MKQQNWLFYFFISIASFLKGKFRNNVNINSILINKDGDLREGQQYMAKCQKNGNKESILKWQKFENF